MPHLKVIFSLLIFIIVQPVFAQKAKYADIYTGTSIKIAGKLGNTIHVWSASANPSDFNKKNITLTLDIFSSDMHLLREKQVVLGKISRWNMEFQNADSCYYTSITAYRPGAVNIKLLKIDPNGNIEDVTGLPQLWTKTTYYGQKDKFFATAREKDFLYIVKIENEHIAGPDEADSAVLLAGDNISAGRHFQKIVFKKINIYTNSVEQLVFATTRNLFYPLIAATDTTVTVSVFAEQESKKNAGDPPGGLFLFIAKLDTSLTQKGTNLLLKMSRGLKNEIYKPYGILQLGNNLLIASKGLYNQETISYSSYTENGITIPNPRLFSTYLTNSLRITMAGNKNNLLIDTIIENHTEGSLQWDNLFTTVTGNTIDFFCSRKYSAYKNGITHFSINKEGIINEEDLIVDVHNNYFYSGSEKIGGRRAVNSFYTQRKNEPGKTEL